MEEATSILETPIPPPRNKKFKLIKCAADSISENLIANQISSKFYQELFTCKFELPGCEILGWKVHFKLLNIDVIKNQNLEDNFFQMKNELGIYKEIMVFMGTPSYSEAAKIARFNANLRRIEFYSGILCYSNPIDAMRDGLTLIAFKALVKDVNIGQNVFKFIRKSQLLPIGILELEYVLKPSQCKVNINHICI